MENMQMENHQLRQINEQQTLVIQHLQRQQKAYFEMQMTNPLMHQPQGIA